MGKLGIKLTSGLATGAMIASLLAPVAFAEGSTLEISGNGAQSDNEIKVEIKPECTLKQENNSVITTSVNSVAKTGGNNASGNTGGDVTIDTGDATSTVTVVVTGSANEATNPCACLCEGAQPPDVLISGNGFKSTNKITAKKAPKETIRQKNNSVIATGVSSKAKTGKNKAKNNTGPGTVEVKTGDSESAVDVTVEGATNTLLP